jgi:hypothetical protein
MTSARSALSRASTPSSSAPKRREKPATSAASTAASRRSTRSPVNESLWIGKISLTYQSMAYGRWARSNFRNGSLKTEVNPIRERCHARRDLRRP